MIIISNHKQDNPPIFKIKTMNKIALLSIITILFALVTSCGPTVDATKMTNTDLSKYDTFAYLPNSSVDMPGKAYNDEDVNNAMVAAVNKQMMQEGYDLDRDNPDLLVLISVKTDTETQVTTDPVYARYPYNRYATTRVSPYYNNYYYRGYNNYNTVVGYDRDVSTYEEGTVMIDLVDRETRNIVWTAVSTDGIYTQSTTGKVKEMMEAIFEEYPLKK